MHLTGWRWLLLNFDQCLLHYPAGMADLKCKFHHVTPLLKSLQWSSTAIRIMDNKGPPDLASTYLSSLIFLAMALCGVYAPATWN